jgi:magnesium-transporting ATPase (P-type)
MTKYITSVRVLREGKWLTISSADLVAGDVLRVGARRRPVSTPATARTAATAATVTAAADGGGDGGSTAADAKQGWVLPCDVVLLRGTCVVDESGLTGESMPVQKVSVPTPQQGGPAFSKKHRLFAGTVLLDSDGRGDGGEDGDVESTGTAGGGGCGCVGIVTATGISTSKGDLVSQILFPTTMTFRYDEELPLVVVFLLLYSAVCFILVCYFLARCVCVCVCVCVSV